ncbi:MAG TPA: YihY/virulence factor BrkB family protein [Nannocystaceae bacterium]|nr:YihY/virulence factor BrkB family protein [Nannocystaceae bacterium]
MARASSSWRKIFALFKTTASDWSDDKASRLAAGLAYYTALSIAPLLVVVIAVAGLVFGADAARGAIMDQLGGLMGTDSAATIESMVESANKPRTGILATIFGVVVLLFGATGVFIELQDSMNTIWEVRPKPGRGVLRVIRQRFLSLSMVFGVAFLLLVSLVVNAGLSALGDALAAFVPGIPIAWQVLTYAVSLLVITLLFAMIFKVLPDVKVPFRDVWIGAAFTAVLFVIGKLLLGLYIGRADLASSYGAAGSVVVMLLWIYYSAQIFFFGAEFTQAYARLHGSRLEPTKNAMPATTEARAQQGLAPGHRAREPATAAGR